MWVGALLLAGLVGAGLGQSLSIRDQRRQKVADVKTLRLCLLRNDSRLEDHLSRILVPRVSGTPGNVAVRQYLTSFLSSLWGPSSVEVDSFSQNTRLKGNVSFANVVATAHPWAPKRLVLACHYDSKEIRGWRPFLGATDSAFPCAAMLRVAEDLTSRLRQQRNPALTLQLVFFDGEEAFGEWAPDDSLYGSTHLADKWYQDGTLSKIDLFVLLDLLGSRDQSVPSHNFGSRSRSGFQSLQSSEAEVQRSGCQRSRPWLRSGSRRLITFEPRAAASWNRGVQGGIQDDHVPFFQRGLDRIVHLIASPFPTVWHKSGDDRSALDSSQMADTINVLRHFVVKELNLPI